MRVVIDGKVYDTDQAFECHRGRLPRGSEETLYASEEGQLFVIHQAPDGEVIGGVAMTVNIASDWLEASGAPVEAYEKAGIEVEEVTESPVKGSVRRILRGVATASVWAADRLIWLMRTFRPDARRVQPTKRINWPKWVKPALIRRQGRTCLYCGYRLTAGNLEIEHMIPATRGGSNEMDNLQLTCRPCNLRKGMQTDQEFRARYSRLIPQKPRTPPRRRIHQREFREETQRTSQGEGVRHFRRTRFVPMRERVITGCLILGGVIAIAVYLALAQVGISEDFALWPSIALGAAAGLGVFLRAHLTGAMLENDDFTAEEDEDTVDNRS